MNTSSDISQSPHVNDPDRLPPLPRYLDSLLLVHNPRFLQLLEEARQRVRITGGVPLAEFRRRIEAAE